MPLSDANKVSQSTGVCRMKRFYDRDIVGFWLLWLGAAGALPSLMALAIFGVIAKHDSGGYIQFADHIRTHMVLSGSALLNESATPISLFRIGGFPALLALLQSISRQNYQAYLVALQIVTQSCVIILTYVVARRLGATPRLCLFAALLPSFGFIVMANISVLTDSLYSAAITTAAFVLVLHRSWRAALIAGLLIAAATTFREATIFLVFAFIPMALRSDRRWIAVALVVLPTWFVAAGQIGWNISRGAGPVLTTSAQVTLVQAVLPLLEHKVPVYNSNTPFDRVASETVGVGGYSQIAQMQNRLFQAGYRAPQMAEIASEEYFRTWYRYPFKMISTTISNYNDGFLAMPFEPLDVIAYTLAYDESVRPYFTRMNVLWANMVQGSFVSLILLLFFVASHMFGSAVSVYGLISPWRKRETGELRWDLMSLWCLPIGLAGLYMPVHLEYRYLLPDVPVICVLAAVGWSGRRRGLVGSPAIFHSDGSI